MTDYEAVYEALQEAFGAGWWACACDLNMPDQQVTTLPTIALMLMDRLHLEMGDDETVGYVFGAYGE